MQLQDANGTYSSTNVTLTTTSETVIVTSPLIRAYRNSAIVMIVAYAEISLGTGTTAVTNRIRRGTTTSDTLVNEANISNIQTAAGSSEHYNLTIMEQLTAEQVVQYSLTMQQTGATGNGTVLESGIIVLAV